MRKLLTQMLCASLLFQHAVTVHAEENNETATTEETEEVQVQDAEEISDAPELDNTYEDRELTVTNAEKILSEETEVGLFPNEGKQLTYYLEPSDSDEIPTWTLEWANQDCITVSDTGYVQASGKTGTASVTAAISSGWSVNYTIYVSEEPESINFDQESYTIRKESYKWISINTDSWASSGCRKHIETSNPDVVRPKEEWTYGSGLDLYGVNNGTATITVTADNGKTASAQVTVKEGIAASIYCSGDDTVYLKPGESKQLSYTLSPSDASEKPVWSTQFYGAEECFAVDQSGIVTAKGNVYGNGYVRATIENGDYTSYQVYVVDEIQSVSFSRPSYTLIAGDSIYTQSYLRIRPEKAGGPVTITSSDENIVTGYVSDSGYLSLNSRNPGTAVITAETENGLKAQATVNVIDGYATSIRSDKTRVFMDVNETAQLSYTLQSSTGNTSLEKVTWEVINGKDLISVSDSGTVSANGYGQATVIARTSMFGAGIGSDYNMSVTYSVYIGRQPKELHFMQDEYTVVMDFGSLAVVSDSPESEFARKTYTSSDESVISVEPEGPCATYFPHKEGTAVITCRADNGTEATVTIHVVKTEPKIYYNQEYGLNNEGFGIELDPGDQIDLKPYIVRSDHAAVDFSAVTWKTSDRTVAVVNNGVITAVNPGKATVEMRDADSGNILLNYGGQVNVRSKLESFRFERGDYYIGINEKFSLRDVLVFEPEKEKFTDVIFETSDESVAGISHEGSHWGITGKKEGTVTVTAVKSSGESDSVRFHISEHKKPEMIVYGESRAVTLHTGFRRKLNISILPEAADQTDYFLVSADPSIVKIVEPNAYLNEETLEISGVRPGVTTVTAALNSDPAQTITFEVQVIDGEPESYDDTSTLSEIDLQHSWINSWYSQDEYTVYVGRYYFLSLGASWTTLDYRERPDKRELSDPPYSIVNSSVVILPMNRGAAGGPTSFGNAGGQLEFIAVHEGELKVKTFSDRIITIHVVNPPQDELEELADEISRGADPLTLAAFEEEEEDVVNKIDQVLNNGETLTVKLEEKLLETVNEEEKDLVVQAVNADEETVIDYYDVDLLLKSEQTDETVARIVETNKPVTVKLPLSEEAKANGALFKVIRIHDGAAKELESSLSEDGNYIVFKTNRFSTYAVVYQPAVTTVDIYGSSLALEGKIGINFYLEIPEEEMDQLTVVMSMNGKEKRVSASEGRPSIQGGKNLRIFAYPVAAKEMRDNVVLIVVDEKGKKIKLTKGEEDYTEGYAFSVSDYFARAEEVGQEKTKKLARVLDNYGKYAQIYFNYNVTDEVNKVTDVSDVTLTTLEPYKTVMTSSKVEGLTYIGGSTMLDDTVGYRLYFKVDSSHEINDYTFALDGTKIIPVKSGSQYYVEVPNILATELGSMNTIQITDGKATLGIRYCALSYAYRALELTDTDRISLQNMCRAMYLYNQQAIEYFNTK